MSANDYAIDALTRHQIYLDRYSSGEIRKLLPILGDMLSKVKSRIAVENLTDFGLARLNTLQRDLSLMINESINRLGDTMLIDLRELGGYEAGFSQRMLDNMITVDAGGVNIDQVAAAINAQQMVMVSGKATIKTTIAGAVETFAGAANTGVLRAVQIGIAEGKNTAEVVKEVERIVRHRTTAQAEAMIRTAANHAGTVARSEVYKENSDVLTGEEFVSVLDSHTSLTCAGLDGRIFGVGEGAYPPLHYNCRSVRVPVVDPAFTVVNLDGKRPSVGSTGVKSVGAKTTYQGWLKRQPASFQDDVLGKEKGALFRRGGLKIDRFTDENYKPYSLDELKQREPEAFKKANI